MNLIEYVRIVLQRGWIAILLGVLAAGAAFAFSTQVEPIFRSTQTVLLVPSRSDFGLTQATLQLLNNRRAYLDSDLRAATIIDELQLDYSPSYLRSRTTITANRDNLTIQIDVDLPAPDAATAAAFINPIAQAWALELIEYNDELNAGASAADNIRASLQDNPRISQLQPRPTLYALIGFIAGFFIGIIVILVLEYLENNIVRRREDLERDGIVVLASVPQR